MYFGYSLALIVCYLLPIFLYQRHDIELQPLLTAREIFHFNSYLTLPIITILHFSYFLSNEYSNNTVKLLFSSKFSKEKIFIIKYIVATITFILQIIPALVLSLIYIYYFYGSTTLMVPNTTIIYNLFETIGKIVFIQLMLNIYFLTLGSITMCINTFVKSRILTILMTFAIIILLKVAPISPGFINYTFINGSSVISGLTSIQPERYFTIFQIAFSSMGFILLFILISLFLFRKQIVQ